MEMPGQLNLDLDKSIEEKEKEMRDHIRAKGYDNLTPEETALLKRDIAENEEDKIIEKDRLYPWRRS